MNREVVTQKIISVKVKKGLKWADIAVQIGQSKEWVTAACLGQMTFNKTQAETAGKIFELTDEEVAWLQIVPYKGMSIIIIIYNIIK
jgi:cyanate lyase